MQKTKPLISMTKQELLNLKDEITKKKILSCYELATLDQIELWLNIKPTKKRLSNLPPDFDFKSINI